MPDTNIGGEASDLDSQPRPGALSWPSVIEAFLIAAVFVVIVVQNSESVELNFLRWSFVTSRVVLMALSAGAGIVVWELLTLARRRNKQKHR